MPSTYSSNLKIELMSTGENSGTWGNITNTNLGTALEQAIVGYGAVSYASDANLTISITNSNAAQAARALVLNVTSAVSLTATRELVVPTSEKQYIVQNNTTGSQSITVKTSAGTGITVPNGRKAHLYVDGTNVIQMFDFVDINGGTIDGTAIGGSSAAAGAFTTLNASGATTLDGNVTLGNASGDNVTVTGTITSHLLFTDNTYDIGANGATRPRNLFLAGAATIGGNLSVGGTLTLTGGLILNGNVTVGDSSADTLTVNATITSNLLFTDNTYDIGASGATRPRNLFLAGNATIGGNQTLTGSLTVDSTTDSSSTTTGSIQTDGGLGVAKALYVGTTANIAGNVTLSGGTANGVAYLNGSKVLTTGSALTFDGTSTFSVVDSSSPRFSVNGSSTASGYLIFKNTTSNVNRGYVGYEFANDGMPFAVAGSEQMRLTSTGLGIGTSNPQSKLHIQSTVGTAETLINLQTAWNSPSGNKTIRWFDGSGALGAIAVNYTAPQAAMTFGSLYNSGYNTTDLMTLTPTGLGIGTSSPSAKLHVQGGSENAIIGNGTRQLYFRADSDGVMLGTGANQTGTGFYFSEASNFIYAQTNSTERMRITSTGEVLVGRTSVIGTNNRLAIQMFGTSASGYAAAPNAALAIDAGTSTNCVLNLVGGADMGVFRTNSSNAYDVGIGFGDNSTRALSFTTANAERARIDSSGRLMVGGTLPFSNSISAVGANTVLDSFGQLTAVTNDSQGANIGGQVTMGGKYRNIGGSSDYCGFGAVAGRKENSTDGNYAGYLQFIVSNHPSGQIERARITSTGVFALGTTTSSSTQGSTIEGSYGNLSFSTSLGNALAGASYYDGSWKYKLSSTATLTLQDSNGIHDYLAVSGTTGSAITWQEIWLTNLDGVRLDPGSLGSKYLRLNTSTSGDGHILFQRNGLNKWQVTSGATDALQFYSYGLGSEAMRMDSNGALLINFSSNPYQNSNTRLAVQGGETPLWVQGTQQGYCQGSIAIASGTADSPSGRGLGTYLWNRGTTATWFMGTAYSAANSWFVMRQTGANFRADTADVGLGWLMQLTSSGVAYQGNNSSTWTTSSDVRIKDDVKTIENGLDVVLALRPVEFYNKITKKREENFIAQEYEQVLAKHITREEPVGAEKEFVTDEILRLNPNLVPYLVSAIQKLNAEIEALKATRN